LDHHHDRPWRRPRRLFESALGRRPAFVRRRVSSIHPEHHERRSTTEGILGDGHASGSRSCDRVGV